MDRPEQITCFHTETSRRSRSITPILLRPCSIKAKRAKNLNCLTVNSNIGSTVFKLPYINCRIKQISMLLLGTKIFSIRKKATQI